MTTRPGDFTPQAKAYARARPGYPEAMVTLLVKILELRSGDAVADVGAGTGLFTRLLTGRGLRIMALEPNDGMRREATNLQAVADGITWRAGTFEDTRLGDASRRWVVAAQAFHWADPAKALPEIRRVLDDQGHLTVLWNNRDNDASPVLTWTRQLIEAMVPNFDEGYRDRDWEEVLTSTGHFELPFRLDVPHVVAMDTERYLDLWRSHNLLNAAAGPERMADFLREVERRLEGTASVDVPYVCRSWTVRAV